MASAYSLDRLGRDGAGDFRGRVAPLVWVRQSADATLMPIAAALAIAIVIGSIAFKPGVRM